MPKPFNRNYGGINPHEVADVGRPVITGELCDQECPNCGCSKLFTIRIKLDAKNDAQGQMIASLTGTSNLMGTYLGCAACPWASQMGIVAAPSTGETDELDR